MIKGEYVTFEIPDVTIYSVSIYAGPASEKSKSNLLTVWAGGGAISDAQDLQDAYRIIREDVESRLERRKKKLTNELQEVNDIITITEKPDWIQLFRKK